MNFIAIDFETADNGIPCEVGVCQIQNGVISETRSWLIKPSCFPFMNYWHQRVHGITNYELEHAPTFDQIWKELQPYINGRTLIAHNAAFDMGVLRAVLNHYHIDYPRANYLCSVHISRKSWTGMSGYKLNELCQQFNVTFNHHRARDDAEACAKIVLKAAKDHAVSSLEGLTSKLHIQFKYF